MSNDDKGSVELDLANKRAIISGPNVISLLSLVCTIGILVFVFLHHEWQKELAAAVRESSQVTMEMTCIVSIPAEERDRWRDWCRNAVGRRER